MRNVTILLAVAAVLALAAPANAIYTYTWVADTDGYYDVSGNWTSDDPTHTIPSGAGDYARVNTTGASGICRVRAAVDVRNFFVGYYNASGRASLEANVNLDTTLAWDIGKGCSTALGEFTQSNGTVITPGVNVGAAAWSTHQGNGKYTISGGSINISSNTFTLGSAAGGVGVFRVEGTGPSGISVGVYTQCAGSTLEIVLDGTDMGVRPIVVAGAATLAGELDVTASAALAKSEYKLMTFASHGGAGFTLDEHLSGAWNLEYRNSDTELWLVPEPATLALLGLGGIGVLLRRRRK